jgi:cyclopropane fatty-acyl-phospholipid synthase-like methyltransferase
MTEISKLLDKPEFPRSGKYDADWLLENQMGPNVLWLMEWLTDVVKLKPGARVLDLGCGRAISSIFLAKEFGAKVWAADWWIGPDHNWERANKAGVADLICPIRQEAHALPFATGFFDAIVSIDAYQYFGTDTIYLDYLASFLREGGQVGVVVPGLTKPFENGVPEHLAEPQANGHAFWEPSCRCFKTADWWTDHWSGCAFVENISTEALSDGWKHWRDFEMVLEASEKNIFPSVAEALEKDQGRYIGFVRATATRNGTSGENLYDPTIGVRYGVDS